MITKESFWENLKFPTLNMPENIIRYKAKLIDSSSWFIGSWLLFNKPLKFAP